jgi:hypothetical protein
MRWYRYIYHLLIVPFAAPDLRMDNVIMVNDKYQISLIMVEFLV